MHNFHKLKYVMRDTSAQFLFQRFRSDTRWCPSSGADGMIMQQMEPKELRADPRINSQTGYNVNHASVIEVAGVIKWFDAAKGYGFIVPDNGMSDVLLDARCLRRAVVEVLRGPRGLQAFRILSMEVSAADHPVPMLPRRARSVVNATNDLQ